ALGHSRGGAAPRGHHRRWRHPSDDAGAAGLGGQHPDGRHPVRRARRPRRRAMIVVARSLLSGAILSGTPLLYATVAEVIGERAGIVNLGLEGVMLMGAVVGFIAMVETHSALVAVVAGALAGALFNLVFAFMVIGRRANQLATGLALMFCGVGLSA